MRHIIVIGWKSRGRTNFLAYSDLLLVSEPITAQLWTLNCIAVLWLVERGEGQNFCLTIIRQCNSKIADVLGYRLSGFCRFLKKLDFGLNPDLKLNFPRRIQIGTYWKCSLPVWNRQQSIHCELPELICKQALNLHQNTQLSNHINWAKTFCKSLEVHPPGMYLKHLQT